MFTMVPTMHDSPRERAAKRCARRAYFKAKATGGDWTRWCEAAEQAYVDALALFSEVLDTRLSTHAASPTR